MGSHGVPSLSRARVRGDHLGPAARSSTTWRWRDSDPDAAARYPPGPDGRRPYRLARGSSERGLHDPLPNSRCPWEV